MTLPRRRHYSAVASDTLVKGFSKAKNLLESATKSIATFSQKTIKELEKENANLSKALRKELMRVSLKTVKSVNAQKQMKGYQDIFKKLEAYEVRFKDLMKDYRRSSKVNTKRRTASSHSKEVKQGIQAAAAATPELMQIRKEGLDALILHKKKLLENARVAKEAGSDILPNVVFKKRRNLSSEARSVLRAWLKDHEDDPYPSEEEKKRLCKKTAINMEQLSNWFINARVREWKPKVSRDKKFKVTHQSGRRAVVQKVGPTSVKGKYKSSTAKSSAKMKKKSNKGSCPKNKATRKIRKKSNLKVAPSGAMALDQPEPSPSASSSITTTSAAVAAAAAAVLAET